jgi:hypothetical protein
MMIGIAVRGTPVRSLPVELVVEDGTDRSVAEPADVDRACGGGFKPFTAERAHEPHDAEAGAEALLGMRPTFQDEFTQRDGCRSDARRFLADTIDGPVGVAPVTG